MRSNKDNTHTNSPSETIPFWEKIRRVMNDLFLNSTRQQEGPSSSMNPSASVEIPLSFPFSLNSDTPKSEEGDKALQEQLTSKMLAIQNAIEVLQPILKEKQAEASEVSNEDLTFELITIMTYLFQIEIIVHKIKQSITVIRHKLEKIALPFSEELRSDCHKIIKSCNECYGILINMIPTLQRVQVTKFTNTEIISFIHGLEMLSAEISSQSRDFNTKLKNIPKQSIENNGLYMNQLPLVTSVEGYSREMLPFDSSRYAHTIQPRTMLYHSTLYFRDMIKGIPDKNNLILGLAIVDAFESIRSTSIILRQDVIRTAQENMCSIIENILNELTQNTPNKTACDHNLYQLFNELEVIRFNTNGFTVNSQHLFKKVKNLSHILRRACAQCEVGRHYLESHTLKRSLIKKKNKR